MKAELTPAQRKAKREIGKLQRRVDRTNQTQQARRERIAKLRKAL